MRPRQNRSRLGLRRRGSVLIVLGVHLSETTTLKPTRHRTIPCLAEPHIARVHLVDDRVEQFEMSSGPCLACIESIPGSLERRLSILFRHSASRYFRSVPFTFPARVEVGPAGQQA